MEPAVRTALALRFKISATVHAFRIVREGASIRAKCDEQRAAFCNRLSFPDPYALAVECLDTPCSTHESS